MESGLLTNVRLAVRAIKKAKKILIASHVNPDGDTIGCQLALGLALLHTGKNYHGLSRWCATRFQFLPEKKRAHFF